MGIFIVIPLLDVDWNDLILSKKSYLARFRERVTGMNAKLDPVELNNHHIGLLLLNLVGWDFINYTIFTYVV